MAYAQLNENDELVNGEPIKVWRQSSSFTYVIDDVTYTAPHNWFAEWDQAQKQAAHMWTLVENIIDPSVERPAGEPTYVFDGTFVHATTPTQDLTLDGYKAVKLDEITNARSKELAEPIFVSFGQTELAFSNDTVPHTLLLDVMTAVNAGLAWPANFKWSSIRITEWVENPPGSDNWEEVETHPQIVAAITQEQAVDIAQAMVLHSYRANKQFIELREEIENATTRAEVDAIVWV